MADHDPMLDGIQRWSGPNHVVAHDGPFVLFSDLPALLAAVRAEEREAMADYWGNRSFDHFRDGLEQGRKEGYARGLIEGDHGGRREGYRSGYAAGKDAVMTASYAQAVEQGQRDERERIRIGVTGLSDWKFCDAVCGTERSVLAVIDGES